MPIEQPPIIHETAKEKKQGEHRRESFVERPKPWPPPPPNPNNQAPATPQQQVPKPANSSPVNEQQPTKPQQNS